MGEKPLRSSTPPPLVPKWKRPQPPLLLALKSKSIDHVRIALHGSLHYPEAARDLFWEHDAEPPLCCAVCLQCSPSIIRLLLQHGACPEAKDKHNRTPLQVLHQAMPMPYQLGPFPP